MFWVSKKEQQRKKALLILEHDRDTWRERCITLENGIEKEFGIKVRQEITEIKVVFDLTELTVLYVALCKLMEKPLMTEDVDYYLSLRKKIEGLMNQIKE